MFRKDRDDQQVFNIRPKKMDVCVWQQAEWLAEGLVEGVRVCRGREKLK